MYFPNPFRLYENNIREGAVGNISFNPPTDNIEKATRIIRILNNLGEQGFDCITDPDDTEIIQSLDDGKSDNEIIKKYMKPCFDELDKLLLEQCKPIDEDRIISLILDGKSRKEIINVLMEECSFDVDMGEFNPNEAIDNLSNVSKWSLNKSTVGKLVWTIAGVLFALLGVYFSTFKTYQTLLKMYEENEKPSFKFKIAVKAQTLPGALLRQRALPDEESMCSGMLKRCGRTLNIGGKESNFFSGALRAPCCS